MSAARRPDDPASNRGPTLVGRRALCGGLATAAVSVALGYGRVARAEQIAVPIDVQVELLAKVADYDRNLAERAGDKVRVLLLSKPDDALASRALGQMRSAFAKIERIGGLPVEVSSSAYADPNALKSLCTSRHMAIVYLTPGFAGDVGLIRDALKGVNVLSAASVPEYVEKGIVLGFDLVSGRPKLLANLAQAREQNVSFKAAAIKLMRVFE